MAENAVQAGSALAQVLQNAVQPKLIENGWVVEENDTTLSEYVTMMIVNGKDLSGVQSELGSDLLGIGEDDPSVAEFARWLFDKVRELSAPQQVADNVPALQTQQQQQQQEQQQQQQQQQQQPQTNATAATAQDAAMDDAGPAVGGAPTGPRSMRGGNQGRGGRGGRILGQLHRQMDRSQELPDNLRRIKGAAGINGRINSHTNRDAPRGPRNSGLAHGIQRMANAGPRGAHAAMGQMNNPMGPMNNGMMSGMPMGDLNAGQQMQFMQMMEMQANLLAQFMQNGAPAMNGNRGGFQANVNRGRGNGAARGRQHQQNSHQPQQQHAVNGRLPDGPLQPNPTADTTMEIDGEPAKSNLFDTLCRFNLSCTNANCGFAHQSPAAPPGTTVDLTDTCSFGIACANNKCSGRHPSPAQKSQHTKQDVDCKFFPNCTNPRCPFRHPTMCRNGADCTTPNCTFSHSKIVCRYNPCLNPQCQFKHADGQKRGNFEDKVWKADGAGGEGVAGKSERFAGFSQNMEGGEEELILPGRDSPGQNGHGDAMQQAVA